MDLWSRLAEDAPVSEAERVLRANWTLLDGVERVCGTGRTLG